MKISVDRHGTFSDIEAQIIKLADQGYKNIMVFHAEGGIDAEFHYKELSDKALDLAAQHDVQIFGGIFPGIFDNGRVMSRGSILAGILSDVHVITLENLSDPALFGQIDKELEPIATPLKKGEYQTLFVFGDGFGECNHQLINALNHITGQFQINVMGGLTGRDLIKSSHYTIFTPDKIIQNGAVLAFTQLASGIGVNHGWQPLMESALEITGINGCFVEEINGAPAFDFYMHIITSFDKQIDTIKDEVMKDAGKFFNHVAVKYPLGLIRKTGETVTYIDRTPVSVGADKSLQFSSEIPVGTQACILHLKGDTAQHQCHGLSQAVKNAFMTAQKNFPSGIDTSRVIIMDCFGRKQTVEFMGKDYNRVEFKEIALDQEQTPHSPIGPLTFGEISSMTGNYVELHNKTAVVGIIEDN